MTLHNNNNSNKPNQNRNESLKRKVNQKKINSVLKDFALKTLNKTQKNYPSLFLFFKHPSEVLSAVFPTHTEVGVSFLCFSAISTVLNIISVVTCWGNYRKTPRWSPAFEMAELEYGIVTTVASVEAEYIILPAFIMGVSYLILPQLLGVKRALLFRLLSSAPLSLFVVATIILLPHMYCFVELPNTPIIQALRTIYSYQNLHSCQLTLNVIFKMSFYATISFCTSILFLLVVSPSSTKQSPLSWGLFVLTLGILVRVVWLLHLLP
jgi:hypothetical protein